MCLRKVKKMKSWETHLHRIKFESFAKQVKEIRLEGSFWKLPRKSAIVHLFKHV